MFFESGDYEEWFKKSTGNRIYNRLPPGCVDLKSIPAFYIFKDNLSSCGPDLLISSVKLTVPTWFYGRSVPRMLSGVIVIRPFQGPLLLARIYNPCQIW